jgi:hypothetical protein
MSLTLLVIAALPVIGSLVGLAFAFTAGRRSRAVWWLGWPIAVTGFLVGVYLPWCFSAFSGPEPLLQALRLLMVPGFVLLVFVTGTLHLALLFGQVMLVLLNRTQRDVSRNCERAQHTV